MKLKVSCELEYQVSFPSTLILSVHAQQGASQTVLDEQLSIEPRLRAEMLRPNGSDNRFLRIETGKKKSVQIHYRATVDCNYDLLAKDSLHATPIAQIDADAIQYLLPSR